MKALYTKPNKPKPSYIANDAYAPCFGRGQRAQSHHPFPLLRCPASLIATLLFAVLLEKPKFSFSCIFATETERKHTHIYNLIPFCLFSAFAALLKANQSLGQPICLPFFFVLLLLGGQFCTKKPSSQNVIITTTSFFLLGSISPP